MWGMVAGTCKTVSAISLQKNLEVQISTPERLERQLEPGGKRTSELQPECVKDASDETAAAAQGGLGGREVPVFLTWKDACLGHEQRRRSWPSLASALGWLGAYCYHSCCVKSRALQNTACCLWTPPEPAVGAANASRESLT